ncbi:MAG: class I SAM-dependent methyltransferase [Nitrospiraceae bacterium]|nr:MAG: class I SAM-dependent methyltransferase [Nitrospiraceae bacterium]
MNNTDNFQKYTSKNPAQRYLITSFLETLFSCVKDLQVMSVLDAGCGEGFVLSEFRNRNVGVQLEGVDFSEAALNMGRKMFPYLNLKKENIYNLPYKDNSFDLVICTEVMEHLETPRKVLDEIMRVSKKYCLFSVPNEPFFMISNFLRGKNLTRWGNDIEHIHHWSSSAFKALIGEKLNVIKVKRPFPWIIVLSEKI